MKKVGKFLICFLPIIAALMCQFAVSAGISSVMSTFFVMYFVLTGEQGDPLDAYLEALNNGNVLMIITAFATAATLVIGVLWYQEYKSSKDFKLKEVINGPLLVAMACLGLALQVLVSMCLNMVYTILPQSLTDQYSALMEQLLGSNVWLSLLVTVVLAPLAEEFLFRGVTMKMAKRVMPFMAANALQALLFGIYHMNLIQGAYAFLLGMVLGFTAEYFHSIWAAILLHAFVNGSGEVLTLLPAQITETYGGIACVAAVGVVLLFVAARLYPVAKKEPAAEEIHKNYQENERFIENLFDE